MPRAGPSRSQPSQRESQPSQYRSQRQRRRRADSENDDNDDGDGLELDLDEDMDVDPSQARGANDQDHLDKKARDLVRFALFSEQKRVPLRREDINKKVLGSYTRSFNTVLSKAQVLLHKTFAMELVELQARNYREEDPAEELQNATGIKKRGAWSIFTSIIQDHIQLRSCAPATAAGSKTYILRSTLDLTIIEQAALTDEHLLEEELVEGLDDDDDEMPRNYGSVIAWSTADQLAALGLLHVILALILSFTDFTYRIVVLVDLRANLKRLRIPQGSNIPSNAQSMHRTMAIDSFLQHLVRQGYLDRVRLGDTKSTGKRRGRLSSTQVNTDENPQAYEWRWGNRAHAEVGEQAVATFVGEFMVEQTTMADVEEEEAGAAGSGGQSTGETKTKGWGGNGEAIGGDDQGDRESCWWKSDRRQVNDTQVYS
ncbi:MAGE-domain-containing protein [Chiua virens]|nr:MAGE-domain-containing protein [Chiua virens]